MYKKRHIEKLLSDIEKMYAAVLVIGARQVGKTTFLENVTGIAKISMDDGYTLSMAKDEPATFLKSHSTPSFFDEIQKCPELFSQLKYEIDKDRSKKALYYMTGSEQPRLMKSASESISGRIGIIRLYGLSLRECCDVDMTAPFMPSEEYIEARKYMLPPIDDAQLWHHIHRGSMPELVLNEDFRWDIYYSSYINTYIDRDVRSDIDSGNELKFTRFMVACAARCGEVLNVSSLAREVGISQPTAERWLDKLCETSVIYLLRPYYSNVTKRVIKSPKLYFSDTGLAAHLTKWNTPEALMNGAFAGHLYENFVVMEIVKSYYDYSPAEPPLYFYRDTNGKEIDLLIQEGDVLHPIEIKKTADPAPKMISAFSEVDNIGGVTRGSGALVCRRSEVSKISDTDFVIPIEYL